MSFEFLFGRNFSSNITSTDIQNAYLEVSTKYYGVNTLWEKLPDPIKTDKRNLCMNYLTAWYLCSVYPSEVKGVDSDSRPLSSKSIGGVSVSFLSLVGQDALTELTTNTFGLQAKSMIESAPERMGIYG